MENRRFRMTIARQLFALLCCVQWLFAAVQRDPFRYDQSQPVNMEENRRKTMATLPCMIFDSTMYPDRV